MAEWNFLTNHGRALLCIAQDPEVRLREIAGTLGITERSAYSIVSDLADAGYMVKEREGRRNRYHIQLHLPLPNTPNREQAIGEVLGVLTGKPVAAQTVRRAEALRRLGRGLQPRRGQPGSESAALSRCGPVAARRSRPARRPSAVTRPRPRWRWRCGCPRGEAMRNRSPGLTAQPRCRRPETTACSSLTGTQVVRPEVPVECRPRPASASVSAARRSA